MTVARTALIVGAAPAEGGDAHYAHLIREAALLIAADAGLDLCLAAGRVPDLCVGDFDSVDPDALKGATDAGARIHRYPVDKDVSDLDLALEIARGEGVRCVTLTAAFSGRLDHTLAALGTLMSAVDLQPVADEPAWKAYPLDATTRPVLDLKESPGTTLSLMALGGEAVVSISGVRYPLSERRISALSSLGLSNVATEPSQHVRIRVGTVIVVVVREV